MTHEGAGVEEPWQWKSLCLDAFQASFLYMQLGMYKFGKHDSFDRD